LACIEGVAIGTDFDFYFGQGRAYSKFVAASASDLGFWVVLWVDCCFHKKYQKYQRYRTNYIKIGSEKKEAQTFVFCTNWLGLGISTGGRCMRKEIMQSPAPAATTTRGVGRSPVL